MDATRYVKQVEQSRRERDDFFKRHPHSPLSPAARATFMGLEYYPVDPAWRVVAKFEPHASEKVLQLDATGGDLRDYREVGSFAFDAPTGRARLLVYRPLGEDWDNFFIPFRDATSGKETYGAGRYLEPDPENEAEGLWVLDFNTAYSPFCAFNDEYSCTLPPRENWIPIAVTAGERAPSGH